MLFLALTAAPLRKLQQQCVVHRKWKQYFPVKKQTKITNITTTIRINLEESVEKAASSAGKVSKRLFQLEMAINLTCSKGKCHTTDERKFRRKKTAVAGGDNFLPLTKIKRCNATAQTTALQKWQCWKMMFQRWKYSVKMCSSPASTSEDGTRCLRGDIERDREHVDRNSCGCCITKIL